ncbi:hypothetical protein RJ640_026886 [Escallonia rubra]|uniref:Protein kinase domain-containing protein n=1 Tax=Escallonia rubra TaxID=112253 RepID=A0AA88SG49_9ASTE|nr:hypothetical protein RJ640_026886 [Escallonia rubra]
MVDQDSYGNSNIIDLGNQKGGGDGGLGWLRDDRKWPDGVGDVHTKPYRVVGTFGYLAPEYMMYGKVDEKIDLYSYGVVLLELITGKKAIHTNQRKLDPSLGRDYNEDEVKTMITAVRLCLLHSSSRRPTMKTILHVFEEPDHWLQMQRQREELFNGISSRSEIRVYKQNGSDTNGTPVVGGCATQNGLEVNQLVFMKCLWDENLG